MFLFFVFFPIINLQSKEPNPKPISPAIKSINPSNQQSTTTKSNLPKSSKISQQPTKPHRRGWHHGSSRCCNVCTTRGWSTTTTGPATLDFWTRTFWWWARASSVHPPVAMSWSSKSRSMRWLGRSSMLASRPSVVALLSLPHL